MTGSYFCSVTVPAVNLGDIIQIRVVAIVNSVTDNGIIFSDTASDIIVGSATSTGTTTTMIDTALSVYKSLIGRTIIFGQGSANVGTPAQITNHNLSTKQLTFQVVANAVVSGDVYRIY